MDVFPEHVAARNPEAPIRIDQPCALAACSLTNDVVDLRISTKTQQIEVACAAKARLGLVNSARTQEVLRATELLSRVIGPRGREWRTVAQVNRHSHEKHLRSCPTANADNLSDVLPERVIHPLE